ncbi:MAG: efflux RND transporter periplasmic adaptor subunit [Candidatus Shapirobacteria bacterium]|nr:efflux RND transporter periplasmic adaptor subunit [Candidatus Shapirobacteria bacterium]
MKKIFNFIKRHKILSIFILVLVIILGVTIPLRVKASVKKNQPQTALVQKENLRLSISATGTVQSENQVDLKFQTSGLLTWVGVKEGDKVKKWQTIASLDKRELEKNLIKTLRDYNKERWDFNEAGEVTYKDQIITDTLKRILEKNQFDLDKAVLDVEIKDIALKFANLTSPIDGIVTHIETPIAGINITPAGAVFTIADQNLMKFTSNIDEVDINQIKNGQKVLIILDAYPNEQFEGTVNKIGFASVTTKGGGTAFPVEIKMPKNDDLRFKVGMNGDIEIISEEKEAVLTVPNQALYQKDNHDFVKILENNKIKEIEVKKGLETDTKTEILEGLSEGQKVITSEKS